jgi:hypothetical protein
MERARRPVRDQLNDDGAMYRHANAAEGGSCGGYSMKTSTEGEKTAVGRNGTLRVGSATVSRSFSSPFSF